MPNLDDHIVSPRADNSVLTIKLHRRHEMLMRLQLLLLLTEIQIPNTNSLIVRWRVQITTSRVQRQTTHPIVMTHETMQMLTRLSQEQFYQLVTTPRQNKRLEIISLTVSALLVQLLQSIHTHLSSKLVLQKLSVHQLSTSLTLDQHHSLNHVVVREKTQHRHLLADVPDHHALVVRTTHNRLPVAGNSQPPDPILMSHPRSLTIASIDFPQLYRLIPWTRQHHISFRIKHYIAHIMIMTEQSLKTQIVIVNVPQFYSQVRRTTRYETALLVVTQVVDRI